MTTINGSSVYCAWSAKNNYEGNYDIYGASFSIIDYLVNIKNPLDNSLATKYNLDQNYPNPFNPTTTIEFNIPVVETRHASSLRLEIFDLLGRKVKTLVNRELPAGKHKVTFDAGNLASGIYFYQLNAGNFTATKKMMLVK